MPQAFSQFEATPNGAAAHQGPLTVGAAAVTLLSLLVAEPCTRKRVSWRSP